jgi:hypothetical protein
LALFAGLHVRDEVCEQDKETEIVILEREKLRPLAYFEEYPQDGMLPLGKECEEQ